MAGRSGSVQYEREPEDCIPLLLDHQKPDPKRVDEILEVLGLGDRRKNLPGQLSGGQQQRAAIGRALIMRPMLILADEPTGNLDSGNSRDVMDLLMKASRYYQQTILMISGSMNSSVARRIRFFGMMRCLGADQRQVRRFVRREALNWCRTAIPLGLGISIIVVWGLCAVLRAVSPAYFSGMQMFGVSIPGLLAGAVIGLTTVILAARSPAKRASRVSLPDCGIGKCREYICGPKDRACQILPCGGCPRDSSCRGEPEKLSFDVRFICFQYHSFPELQPRA